MSNCNIQPIYIILHIVILSTSVSIFYIKYNLYYRLLAIMSIPSYASTSFPLFCPAKMTVPARITNTAPRTEAGFKLCCRNR